MATMKKMNLDKVLLDDGKVEVRFNEDGTIDEIVTHEPVQVTYEYMDKDSIDLHIGNVRVAVYARVPKRKKRPVIKTGMEDWGPNAKDTKSYGEFED